MDFLTLAKQRCSVRRFKKTEVEEEKLEKLLEAAHVAPTAANQQSQRLLVVKSAEGLQKLSKATNSHGAPLAIIICGDHDNVFVRPFDGKDMVEIDATIVADHIVMEAEDLGLSSCWITYFEPSIVKKEFNIPSNLEPVAILSIGYADGKKSSPDRHVTERTPIDRLHFTNIFNIFSRLKG